MGVSVGTIYPRTMALDEITHRVRADGKNHWDSGNEGQGDLKQPSRLGTFVNERVGWGVQ